MKAGRASSATSHGDRLDELAAAWRSALRAELPSAVRLRQELHADPRLSGSENDTAARLEAELGDRVAMHRIADSGRIGRLGPSTGGAVGVRAELDALPLTELTGVPFAATNGAMHACGHDVHQAALVAFIRAADHLELPVGLVPILQPREETYPSGAHQIVQEGGLERFQVHHVIGAHVHPGVPRGAVAIGGGYINAAADEIEISLQGRGGHGAYPHQAADPVAAIAQIALGLPEVVRRTISPMNPAVISVGTLSAGEGAANVLPSSARLLASMRTTAPKDRELLFSAVQHLAMRTAEAYGTEAVVHMHQNMPVLINDAHLASDADDWLARLGVDGAEPMRSLGGDDFSYYCDEVPSIMCFAGVETAGLPGPDGAYAPTLHHPRFLPTEDAVGLVASAFLAGYCAAAERILGIAHHRRVVP
ncbi:MAG: M20 metallopeptidase family protein [Pseudoclavibacter sp.]